LVWTFNYYFKGCISWRWNYRYSHAPTLKDLDIYLNSIEDINNYTNYFVSKLNHQQPVSPIVQLMTIMPKTSIQLLPLSFRKLMTNVNYDLLHYYPESYNLDTLFKRYYWQCVPILPSINLDIIQENVEKIKCSKKIKDRYAMGELTIKDK
jgi:5'-3' exonuclease